jgi:hypothetical protein
MLSEYGWIWNPDREVLQEVNLILDAIALGYSFTTHKKISHVYRYGWSTEQITQRRRDLYPDRLEDYYNRLEGFVPPEYATLASEWKDKSIEAAIQTAEDFRKYGIDPIPPQLP